MGLSVGRDVGSFVGLAVGLLVLGAVVGVAEVGTDVGGTHTPQPGQAFVAAWFVTLSTLSQSPRLAPSTKVSQSAPFASPHVAVCTHTVLSDGAALGTVVGDELGGVVVGSRVGAVVVGTAVDGTDVGAVVGASVHTLQVPGHAVFTTIPPSPDATDFPHNKRSF